MSTNLRTDQIIKLSTRAFEVDLVKDMSKVDPQELIVILNEAKENAVMANDQKVNGAILTAISYINSSESPDRLKSRPLVEIVGAVDKYLSPESREIASAMKQQLSKDIESTERKMEKAPASR